MNAEQHTPSSDTSRWILVTGSTGYVGGRLVPRLLEAGYSVRCLVRNARKLDSRPWAAHPRVEVVEGDLADTDSLARHMQSCRAGYYLVHSMISKGKDYRDEDLRLASSFAAAAARANLERIVYLGGLGETGDNLSEHLASRREVERALASGPVPVTVLRAAMIIGSGSASFEILRYLVERLPAMITPKWVSTECQPISIHDTLHYLVSCLEVPKTRGRTLDIGGSDVLTYLEIMQIVAKSLGLRKRIILPVPVLTPWLSSLWIHIVTPVDAAIARPLADGLRNPVVCRDDQAQQLMPCQLLSVREAVDTALTAGRNSDWETAWTDAGVIPGDPDWAGGKVYIDERSTQVAAPPEQVFSSVCQLGGRHGWFDATWLWKLRGLMDRLIGGPGLGRGRRHATTVAYGDTLDFWRVVAVVPGEQLSLRAEMKLPGIAGLDFTLKPTANGTQLTQTARFRPRGLAGIVYWYLVTPLHGIVFRNMLHGIQRRAERAGTTT